MATQCKSCAAEIIFIKMVGGKRMPCNAELTTVIVADDGTLARGHIPHWATCPQADEHRKTQRRMF